MPAIQWRPEVNALTTPQSYSIRFVARNSVGLDDLASDIALRHPNFSKADILTILRSEDEAILARLLHGEQVTKEGSFSWFPSFTGRLNTPDDPLPPLTDCLHISTRVSPPFLAALRQNAKTERLPMEKKLPLISTVQDTLLGLKDALNPAGVLQLIGENLFFDQTKPDAGGCVIEGTQSGTAAQSRFVRIEPSEILLMPELPAQAHPWNNEYKVSLSTRYSEHGTLRTGTYGRMLRTPLAVRIGDNAGILSSSGSAPLVTVSGGTLAEDETRLRIQVLYNAPDGELRFRLIDMEDGGKAGNEVRAAANGVYTLPGWTGCGVSSLELTVANYSKLLALVRNPYGNRLVDILDVSVGT